jgi:serine/threonine protein kinase
MPASHPTNVSQFASLLVKSRLLPPEEVLSAQNRWKQNGNGENDVEGFRKALVQAKQLTEYQSALLNRGHTEGYFIGEYTITDLIGKGRMAGVYKAVHRSGQTVAIKVLPPSKAKEGQLLARFQREAKLLTKLNHPNVVRAFEVGESTGRHFFVMEALDGVPLDEVIEKRKKLPPLEAIRIIYQAMLGLQHLYEKGMIHRDLKPANLMLTPSPRSGEDTLRATVKILDIGLGRMMFEEASEEPPETQLTGENVLLGTPDYLAPEQARNAREADIRADIYSLGCTLYHCLTGRPPFPDTNVLTQVLRHSTETARPLTDFIENVPPRLQEVLDFLMAKTPAQRYPNPLKASQALEPLLSSIPNAQEPSPPTSVQPGYERWLQSRDANHGTANEPNLPTLEAISPIVMPTQPPVKSEKPASPTTSEKPLPKKKDRTDPVGAPVQPSVRMIETEEFDVVAVRIEEAPAPPLQRHPPKPVREEREPRSLFDLDRRDFLMLGIGSGGVIAAILTGYGLAQLIRSKTPTPEKKEPPEEKKEPTEEKGEKGEQ